MNRPLKLSYERQISKSTYGNVSGKLVANINDDPRYFFRRAKNVKKIILTSRNRIPFRFEQFHKYHITIAGACPGIRRGGGAQHLKAFFFFAFQFFRGGGPLGPPWTRACIVHTN